MKKINWVLSAILLAGLYLAGEPAYASNGVAEKEELACTVCHDKPGSKLMTDKGKYYGAVGTLEGYEELVAGFGSCTKCHVKKPGSLKLTKTGRQFQWMMTDMEGLRQWLMERHPVPPEEEGSSSPAGGSERGEGPAGAHLLPLP